MHAIELRDYQRQSEDGLRAHIRDGARNLILSIPTGGGKTVIAAHMMAECRAKGRRAIFVADRIALIDQTSATLDRYAIDHGVLQGQHWRYRPAEPIQVASVQTLARRGWPQADLIIVDECHALQKTVTERISARATVCIGLTATPITRGLGRFYDRIVTVATTNTLIREQFLVPFRVFAASEPDMSGIKTVAGEWSDDAAAERAMPIIGDCVEEYLRHGAARKFIAFGCNVRHCEEMQRQFAAAGVLCELVTYRSGDEARAAAIAEFRKPDSYLRGLISVSALSKGFDVSDVEVIIMARPLKSSLAEHMQILGRGLRSHAGKRECIVLDHSGNCLRFWSAMHDFLEHGASVLDDAERGARAARTPRERMPMRCPACAHVHDALPACPVCGKMHDARTLTQHAEGALHEVAAAARPGTAGKADFHAQLLAIAHQRGYAHGWAANKFREKYGAWPDEPAPAPRAPTAAVLGWVRSRAIAFAKGRQA
ncbi:DEAD/DEAH box helicase [Massilia violaceinigra]|uniref:DEAD/DEAH box helicase n=1 Tax=Massilia violaceinigra TaxID=2045208 RepID=A0ABY4AA72_9BURK|nr:DEAD/DEAH box helicase [Massilia violaceinigra]UOD31690.1 DEAD/DEAH box helicase [Massilia violaceinigra]